MVKSDMEASLLQGRTGLLTVATTDASLFREWQDTMRHDGIPIGELLRRTGCNIETIRYYERIGPIAGAAPEGALSKLQ
jgi:hypothetical protein